MTFSILVGKDKIKAAITGLGVYTPPDILTNNDLEKIVDTNNEWIVARTGIKERRILKDPAKPTSYMAIKATRKLLTKTNTDPLDIDVVILSTVTPDMNIAATAVHVAREIGAKNAFGYDLQAACSGFLYGFSTATAYIESGRYKKVLLIGADKMSSIVDYTDRATCIIFGDAAGAILVEPNNEGYGLQDEYLRGDSLGRNFLKIEAGGSLNPITEEAILTKKHYIKQEGQTVFKYAVSNMANSCKRIMSQNNLDKNSLDWMVPHQANQRIITATGRVVGISAEKVMSNIERYGNTTSATIPLVISEYEHLLKKGDNLIMTAFGGGFTWGANYLKWAY